jgi:hypothetical protein
LTNFGVQGRVFRQCYTHTQANARRTGNSLVNESFCTCAFRCEMPGSPGNDDVNNGYCDIAQIGKDPRMKQLFTTSSSVNSSDWS